MKKNLIDFLFLMCLLVGGPIVAFVVIQHGRPYESILYTVLNVGFIAGMCGALFIILGVPWAIAGLSTMKHKEQFRLVFVGAWLLVNGGMVFFTH